MDPQHHVSLLITETTAKITIAEPRTISDATEMLQALRRAIRWCMENKRPIDGMLLSVSTLSFDDMHSGGALSFGTSRRGVSDAGLKGLVRDLVREINELPWPVVVTASGNLHWCITYLFVAADAAAVTSATQLTLPGDLPGLSSWGGPRFSAEHAREVGLVTAVFENDKALPAAGMNFCCLLSSTGFSRLRSERLQRHFWREAFLGHHEERPALAPPDASLQSSPACVHPGCSARSFCTHEETTNPPSDLPAPTAEGTCTDQVTTLMLKHLPSEARIDQVVKGLEAMDFAGKYDLLVILGGCRPREMIDRTYGFINFIKPGDSVAFARTLATQQLEGDNPLKNCRVRPAQEQGREATLQRLRDRQNKAALVTSLWCPL